MSTQTDLDRLQIAWARLQAAVNKTLPTQAAAMRALAIRITNATSNSSAGPGK